MFWFLLIVGLLIFAPGVLLILGAGALMLAIPFVVFFVVWGAVVFGLAWMLGPHAFLPGVALGFVAGIFAARQLVKSASVSRG